jgi:nicotinate-nucleotide adenylyltransferase
MAPIGIYGGTFDPIHYGHLRSALELFEELNLDHVRFIPSSLPVHRVPTKASTVHRLAMLELALQGQKAFILDRREIERVTPSYTFLTLLSLREDFPQNPLCLIMGVDAFSYFDTWYEWEKILDLAHIICINRPQFSFQDIKKKEKLYNLVLKRQIEHPEALKENKNGLFYLAETTPLAINATAIRTSLAQGKNADYLLPANVLNYILQHGLYRSET